MKKILGHNDPHYFDRSGNRVKVAKDEARRLSWEYFEDIFLKKGYELEYYRDIPTNHGQCRILKEITDQSETSEDWIIQYKLKDFEGGIETRFTLNKNQRGVVVRDSLRWVLALLENDGDVEDEFCNWNVTMDEYLDFVNIF